MWTHFVYPPLVLEKPRAFESFKYTIFIKIVSTFFEKCLFASSSIWFIQKILKSGDYISS